MIWSVHFQKGLSPSHFSEITYVRPPRVRHNNNLACNHREVRWTRVLLELNSSHHHTDGAHQALTQLSYTPFYQRTNSFRLVFFKTIDLLEWSILRWIALTKLWVLKFTMSRSDPFTPGRAVIIYTNISSVGTCWHFYLPTESHGSSDKSTNDRFYWHGLSKNLWTVFVVKHSLDGSPMRVYARSL